MKQFSVILLLVLAVLCCGRFDIERVSARPFPITTIESRPETTRESSGGAEKPPSDGAGRDLEILKYACKIKGTKSSGVNTPFGVLTCWHCVNGAHNAGTPIYVTQDDETVQAVVIAFDTASDLALLKVKWASVHAVAMLDTMPLTVDQWVFTAGRHRDGEIMVDRYRVVESPRSDGVTIFTDNPFFGGQSGSGVFNSKGLLVGIARAVDLTDEPYRGMSANAEQISKLVDMVSPPKAAANGPPLSVVIYIKAHCKPGDAACQLCQQQVDLVGNGDKRIRVTISTDPIPSHIRIPKGYLYPVIVWETKDRCFWPKNPGVYSLDQIVEMVERTSK